jgi:hypothetical protein
MTYKKSDFNYCQFNPLIEGRILAEYPKLTEVIAPEWNDENLEAIMRYIILVYDPKSPLILNERDLNYRKDIGFALAGITDETLMDTVSNSTHVYSSELTVKYLMRFARSKEWAAICAFEFSFWESIKEVTKPISGRSSKEILESVQKKAAIKEEIEKDIKRLENLYRTFLGEDEALLIKTRKRLTPELVAK